MKELEKADNFTQGFVKSMKIRVYIGDDDYKVFIDILPRLKSWDS